MSLWGIRKRTIKYLENKDCYFVRIAILIWWRWGESTCAAAQATSRLWRAAGTPFTTAWVRFPTKRKKKHPARGRVLLFGGGGGNRTPVRKRLNRNFSGRRRLFTFPRPGASRHAQGLGSFMIHGALKALRTHGHHLSTPHPGPWSSRVRRSLLRQREQQDCCCSLIYKLPILWMVGASARYSCLHTPVETSTPPRQKNSAPFRFRGLRKSRENFISVASFFLSKSNPLRWASIW